MATILTDSQSTTTTGVKAPATVTKFPEFGATFAVGLTAGSATVQLKAWVNPSYKEVLATFTLSDATELSDALPVSSVWTDWEWNVTALSGGGTLTLGMIGRGT